jgi:hypothetical protein
MRRSVSRPGFLKPVFFAVALCAVALSSAAVSPAEAQAANNTPLAFGMNVDQVSAVLGTTLVYVRGRPGNEMFLALPNVKGSALSDRRDGLYLQFRRGKLEGWKGDWGTNRPCCR